MNPFYANLKTENSAYNLTGRMVSVEMNVLFQKWIRDYTVAFNLRFGGGIIFLSNIKFNNKNGSQSEKISAALISLNTGASIQWSVWKSLFIEASVEYRGFPKTSVFGKATLDLEEKAAFKPLFPKPFPKLTGFWERLYIQAISSQTLRPGFARTAVTFGRTF